MGVSRGLCKHYQSSFSKEVGIMGVSRGLCKHYQSSFSKEVGIMGVSRGLCRHSIEDQRKVTEQRHTGEGFWRKPVNSSNCRKYLRVTLPHLCVLVPVLSVKFESNHFAGFVVHIFPWPKDLHIRNRPEMQNRQHTPKCSEAKILYKPAAHITVPVT